MLRPGQNDQWLQICHMDDLAAFSFSPVHETRAIARDRPPTIAFAAIDCLNIDLQVQISVRFVGLTNAGPITRRCVAAAVVVC